MKVYIVITGSEATHDGEDCCIDSVFCDCAKAHEHMQEQATADASKFSGATVSTKPDEYGRFWINALHIYWQVQAWEVQ